jgi:mono/diheme cytochrome c family protein
MFKRVLTVGWVGIASVVIVSAQGPPRPAPAVSSEVVAQGAVLKQYCIGCHNQRLKTANLLIDQLDLAHLREHAETGEQIVRKLRAGMMPPAGLPRPDAATRQSLITWMEAELDRGSAPYLEPPGLHRLNRAEYQNAIRDLLGLEIDAAKFLPSDNSTHGFDNIAGALTMSPALLEAYVSAAAKISRLAVGRATAPVEIAYPVPADATQDYHVEGLPFATRGGILIHHEFPADGDYRFKITPVAEGNMGQLNNPFGRVKGEQLELLIDGAVVKVLDWDKEMQGFAVRTGVETPPVQVKAGNHAVGVTFVATNQAPGNDINEPFARTTIDTGPMPGFTFYPHVGIVRIVGPFDAHEATDSPSRRRILTCHPAKEREEPGCARAILTTLARRALRRPTTQADVGRLMEFYESGRGHGTFDDGIEQAIQRLLVDPEFIYRGEDAPAAMAPGQSYPITDFALASRLSFFLWSSIPDDELLNLASQRRLRQPAVLEQQVRRMIADPKSAALVENFTGQWLNLRGLATVSPDPNVFPDFDDNLRQAFRKEVELFFSSIVHEDRSVFDLLTADYTFVDERLARHYGIPYVRGSRFQRVILDASHDVRRGLLGKGALMAITSQATRTSPVTRGKWFLQTFLGVSPPDPPPNVDTTLKIGAEDAAGNNKNPTMRQIMEVHRANPTCATCHKIFEPIGFALENFDAIGAWRLQDEGVPIDVSGLLVDGSTLNGVTSLRQLLTRYSDQFARVIAERLLTYALGRGVEYQDMPLVRAVVRDAEAHEYRFSSFVLGVVKSVSFQQNLKAPAVAQVAR